MQVRMLQAPSAMPDSWLCDVERWGTDCCCNGRCGNGHFCNGHCGNGHCHNGHCRNGHCRNGHCCNGRCPLLQRPLLQRPLLQRPLLQGHCPLLQRPPAMRRPRQMRGPAWKTGNSNGSATTGYAADLCGRAQSDSGADVAGSSPNPGADVAAVSYI